MSTQQLQFEKSAAYKSKGLAIILSACLPGLGVCYVSPIAGIVLFILFWMTLATVIVPIFIWLFGMLLASHIITAARRTAVKQARKQEKAQAQAAIGFK